MDANVPPKPAAPAARPRVGLAIACLTMGVLAVFGSIFLVGALAGLLAMLLGAIHISKRHGPNAMAWAGIGLAVLGIVLSVGAGALYLKGFRAAQRSWTSRTDTVRVLAADEGFAEWIGKKVPEFTVTSLAGETFTSSDWQGRRVILDFWATWCSPCRMEIPHFVRLSEENPRDRLLIIGISTEDTDTLAEFVEERKVTYPIVSTEDLPPPFDSITAIPTTFFIDRHGIIQNVLVGYHDYDDLKELALADDTVGQPPEPAGDGP